MLAWTSVERNAMNARGQTDECDAHREANHTEHVGDLQIVVRPEHRHSEARLVVQDSVENHADHHENQNEIAGLRSKRNRAHGAKKN